MHIHVLSLLSVTVHHFNIAIHHISWVVPHPYISTVYLSVGGADIPHPGDHLSAGEHPGHHGYREEQEPPLAYVLLCLQVTGASQMKSQITSSNTLTHTLSIFVCSHKHILYFLL